MPPHRGSLDHETAYLALAVAGITFILLACASVASLFERKRAEEALRQAQTDLAHVTCVTTLGELTASIAHEVNQPLAAVVTNAEACLRWLDRGTPKPGRSTPRPGADHRRWQSGGRGDPASSRALEQDRDREGTTRYPMTSLTRSSPWFSVSC
jgi:signal transduction histidine kinase